MEKHRFWTSLYRRPVSSKQDHEVKNQVQSVYCIISRSYGPTASFQYLSSSLEL
jgi:hypothetical protein